MQRNEKLTFAKRIGTGFLLLLASAIAELIRAREGTPSAVVVVSFLVQVLLGLSALTFIVWGIFGAFYADAKGIAKFFSKDPSPRR